MKFKLFFLTIIALMASCKDNKPATGTFGATFDTKDAYALTDALNNYNTGKDTTYTIAGTIDNICQHKGCWMSFKDASGKEFIINTGEKFVLPASAKGHKATAQGKFVKDDKGKISFETTGVIIE